MTAGLLSAFALLMRPGAMGTEVLLAAGLLAAALTIAVVVRNASAPRVALPAPARHRFAALRVLLRASDPSAEGHPRARAPGTRH